MRYEQIQYCMPPRKMLPKNENKLSCRAQHTETHTQHIYLSTYYVHARAEKAVLITLSVIYDIGVTSFNALFIILRVIEIRCGRMYNFNNKLYIGFTHFLCHQP